MNATQTIFTLFYAIFWSTVANAWPRWKPFHWPLALKYGRVRCRLACALLVLNLLPAIVAGVTLWLLEGPDQAPGPRCFWQWISAALVGVVSAFSIFGFSRLWTGVIELWPGSFYFKRDELRSLGYPTNDSREDEIEPSQESVHLSHPKSRELGVPDIVVGIAYIIGALAVAVVFRG